MSPSTLTAILLCGGKSTRMGTDKGLLIHEKNTWAEIGIEKFKTLNLEYFISINETQKDSYRQLFPKDKLIIDKENIPGPLAGLISCSRYTKKDMLVLACDLLFMETSTLGLLIEAYKKKEFDFYAFKNENYAEPLAAIYTVKGLQKVYTLWQESKLKNFSLQYQLDSNLTHYIQVPPEQRQQFRNLNTQNDLI